MLAHTGGALTTYGPEVTDVYEAAQRVADRVYHACRDQTDISALLEAASASLAIHARHLKESKKSRAIEDTSLIKGTYWTEWEHVRQIIVNQKASSTSRLRILPPDLLAKVARCAFRPRHRPSWRRLNLSDSSGAIDAGRYTLTAHESDKDPSTSLPYVVRPPPDYYSGVQYYKLSVTHVWFGTEIRIMDQLLHFISNHSAASLNGLAVQLNGRHISLWDEVWEHCGTVTLDILLQGTAASPFVTIALNGVAGPRLPVTNDDHHMVTLNGDRADQDDDEDFCAEITTPACVPSWLLNIDNAEHGMCDGRGGTCSICFGD